MILLNITYNLPKPLEATTEWKLLQTIGVRENCVNIGKGVIVVYFLKRIGDVAQA